MTFHYPNSTKLLLQFASLLCLSLGGYLIYYALQIEHFQALLLCCSVLPIAFGFVCLEDSTKTLNIDKEGVSLKTMFRKKQIKTADIKGYGEINHPTTKYRYHKNYQKQLVIFSKSNKHIKIEPFNWGENYDLLLKAVKNEYTPVKQAEKYALIQQRKNGYKNIGKGIGIIIVIGGVYLLITQGRNSNPIPEIGMVLVGLGIIFYYQYISKGYD